MEILISIGISSGVQILKVVAKKIGLELTKKITAGVVLLSCLAFSYLMERDILTWEMIQSFSSLFLISVGYYEIVYKKVLTPLFNGILEFNTDDGDQK